MVQILPPRRTFSEAGRALGGGLGEGLLEGYEKSKKMSQMSQENEAAKRMGIDLSGITDPKMRQITAQEGLKNLYKEQQRQQKREYFSSLFGGQGSLKEMGDQLSQELGSSPQEYATGKNFDVANIPDEIIAQVAVEDPQLGNLLQRQKDVAQRENRAEREFSLKEKKASPEFKREERVEASQAQADVKYNQQLQEASKQHELKEQTLDRLEKLNTKGVTGKPYEKFLEKMGLTALTSSGRREFAADVKNLITDIRSILGAQFTGFEFQTILNAYPSADFSKDANTAIIKNLKDFQDIKKKEVEFANKLKKENGGKIPFDFQSTVNEMVHEYANTKVASIKENTRKIMNAEYKIPAGKTLMFDPEGEPLGVPEDEIAKWMELGATLP